MLNVKDFVKEINNLLFFTPKPASRNDGHIPNDFKVSSTENLVNLSWIQEVMVFGEIYYHNVNFSIVVKNDKWFFSAPISGNQERFSWWPNFIKYGKVGEEFNMEKFLNYYRIDNGCNFDWSTI